MEDWIVLDDKQDNSNNNVINSPTSDDEKTNNFILQIDNEIKQTTYESNSNQYNNYFKYFTQERNIYSCSYIFNTLYLQLKTIQYYIISIMNDFKLY